MKIEKLKEKLELIHSQLERYYPHKQISEYTRLMDQIETSLTYGIWYEIDEDE